MISRKFQWKLKVIKNAKLSYLQRRSLYQIDTLKEQGLNLLNIGLGKGTFTKKVKLLVCLRFNEDRFKNDMKSF